MAQKTKRTSSDARIRESVRCLLSAGRVSLRAYPLPAEAGAQISMTGAAQAWGNAAEFPENAVAEILTSLPPMAKAREDELVRYARRMRFFIQPGDCDRFVAAAAAVAELRSAGFIRIILAADTPAERDALAAFFSLTKAGMGNLNATVYLPGEYGNGMTYDVFASIYGYLTSPGTELLILDAASFCRRTNLLRRAIFPEDGSGRRQSLADLAGEGRPAVLCCARTADSARNLAEAAEVFRPALTLMFPAQSRKLRDAVICAPETGPSAGSGKKAGGRGEFPEQIGF